MFKKLFKFVLTLSLMYICCKFPDQVVAVCEFGFKLAGDVFGIIAESVSGVFSTTA